MEQEIQQQPPQLNPIPPNNKKKILILIIGVLVIAVFATADYFLFSKRLVTPTETQTQQVSVSTNIAGWQKYKNEKYGFELEYPLEWQPLEEDKSLCESQQDGACNYKISLPLIHKSSPFTPNYNICFASANRNEFSSCEMELYISKDVSKFSSDKIDFLGLPVYNFKGMVGGIVAKMYAEGQTKTNIFIQKDGLIYLFTLAHANDETDEQFLKILSTFKFFNSPQAYKVTLYAYEKDGSHIFDGAVIAAIDTSTGKIIAEQIADRDGKVVFSLIPGTYRFQPSPLRENRIVGSLNLFVPLEENKPQTLSLTEIGPSSFGAPVDTCEEKKEAITLAIEQANYCEADSDCKLFQPGGFSCYVYTNQSFDSSTVLQRVNDYGKVCPFAAYKCAQLEHSPSCIQGKCYTGR